MTCCRPSRPAGRRLIAAFAGLADARRLRPDPEPRCSRRWASSAGSARAPTWCARRCTTSPTRAAATSPCGPRARRRWPGPSSSTARPTPWKVWYAAPSFRYERAQANRYRQHHQLGVEAIGSADPDLDVEVIALLADFYRALGLRQVDLRLNSIGTPADRAGYIDQLRSFLAGAHRRARSRRPEKVEAHPMRVLDSKRPGQPGRGGRRARCCSTTSRPRRRPTSSGCRPA